MSGERTKVVLVGCGGMARAWVKKTLEIEELELVGLVDIRREAAEEMARRHELPPTVVFDSLRAAVKKTGATAVFDVTVPSAHHAVTLEALKLGCHVLGEKPMSDTLARARKMVAAAGEAGKLYGVTQTRRPTAGVMSVAEFVRSGALGKVEELHSDFYIGAHFGGFRDQMEDVLLVDMSIHTLDAARQISGADPVSVVCRSWNPPHSWYRGHASACAIFEMMLEDGSPVVYTYRGSWCAEGLDTSWQGEWRVVCQRGTLKWNGEDDIRASRLKENGNPGFQSVMEEVEVPRVKPAYGGHEAMIRNFAAALRGRERLISPCEDNIKSLAMVLAAVKSARSDGRPVEVAV